MYAIRSYYATFNNTLIAIDEFHHVSADAENRLGDLLREIMNKSTAHIIAMTGSYFRGDSIPVLRPEDEEKFTKVTYNYYEQLNGRITSYNVCYTKLLRLKSAQSLIKHDCNMKRQ